MRLADFIETHTAEVLSVWEAFASTLLPAAGEMDASALRDHAEQILQAVARDLRTSQSRSEQAAKSRGEVPRLLHSPETAVETHAVLRASAGFTVQQLVAEYRALRASVLGLWADADKPGPDTLIDVTRFNEAIDQALAESVNFFAIEAERSELRYRQLFEHIPDGVFIADPQGRYIDVNRAGCEMLAMTRQELLGSRLADVLPPPDYHRLRSELEKMEGGAVMRSEWTFQRKNGTRFIGEVTGRPDLEGNVLGVLRDVTHVHRAEESRLESEQRFRVMADGLPLIIWVHNASGELEYVNNTYCEYFGVTAEEAMGDRWKVLTHPDDGEAYFQEFVRCSRERQPFRGQVRVRRDGGEWRWIESWARPRWAGGEFAGMVGTSADITERTATASAMQEADRRKDEFLALLAHELRNPLAPLRTGLDLLRLAKDNEEASERARSMMQRQVTHMVRLVDDLLDVSRIASGKLELRSEVLDVSQIIGNAIETSAPALQAGGHELISSIPPSTYHVCGDAVRLAQVFANLLNNAPATPRRVGESA